MAAQFLWILLVLIEVAQAEQPIFVPSAAELSDAPPENKQDWLHPVIFEPQNKIKLTRSTYQVTIFLDFAPFMNGLTMCKTTLEASKKMFLILHTFLRLNIKAQTQLFTFTD